MRPLLAIDSAAGNRCSLTAIVPTETPTTEKVVEALLAAHGDLSLAAERLHIDKATLWALLPSPEELLPRLKVVRLLQAFDMTFLMHKQVQAVLGDMPPQAQGKLMIDYLDRFEAMINPAVHGGSGQGPVGSGGVTVNLLNNVEDARGKLLDGILRSGSDGPDSYHDSTQGAIESVTVPQVAAPQSTANSDIAAAGRNGTGAHV